MNQPEAWGSGTMKLALEGDGEGYAPIFVAVEMLRISRLVHVMARADTDEPRFKADFPIVLATVEAYPEVYVDRDPLQTLGVRMRDSFVNQVHQHISKLIARDMAVANEMAQLALETGTGRTEPAPPPGGSGDAAAAAVSSEGAHRSGD